MLNQTDLNLLRVLVTFSREGSVLTTAKALKVTPSAVSQALKRLEDELEIQLFIRSHKKLTLTPEARHLVDSVLPLLTTVQDVVENLKKRKHLIEGEIRIGAPVEFGTNVLIPIFSQFTKQYPKVSLGVKLGSPRTLLAHLQNSDLDLAFCDDGPYFAQFRSTLLTEPTFSEELILVCSKSFFEENHLIRETSFKKLTSLRHVDYSDDHSAINIWYQHHFKKRAEHLNLSLISENVHALIQGVKQGLGLGMIPSYLVKRELATGSLVAIRTGKAELRNAILLVQNQKKIPRTAEKLLISHIKKSSSQFTSLELHRRQ
jgi:DNA-binding transcriptional LysR family regulator